MRTSSVLRTHLKRSITAMAFIVVCSAGAQTNIRRINRPSPSVRRVPVGVAADASEIYKLVLAPFAETTKLSHLDLPGPDGSSEPDAIASPAPDPVPSPDDSSTHDLPTGIPSPEILGETLLSDSTVELYKLGKPCPLLQPTPIKETHTTGQYWVQQFSAFDLHIPDDRRADQNALLQSIRAHCHDRWSLRPLLGGKIGVHFESELQEMISLEKKMRASTQRLYAQNLVGYHKRQQEISQENREQLLKYERCPEETSGRSCRFPALRTADAPPPMPPILPPLRTEGWAKYTSYSHIAVSAIYFNGPRTLALVYVTHDDGSVFHGGASWEVFENTSEHWERRPSWGTSIKTHD